MHPRLVGEAVRDLVPALPVVGRLERSRREVVELVSVVGDVRRRGVVGGHGDRVDETLLQAVGCHVLPRHAVVSGQVDEAIVAARPERARLVRRFCQIIDRAVDLPSGAFVGDRATTVALLAVLVAREIRADFLPRHAPITRPNDVVRRVVDRVGVVGGGDDRSAPVVAVLHLAALQRSRHDRVGGDVPRGHRLVIELRDDAHVAARVHEARIIRIEGGLGALAPAHRIPILPRHAAGASTRDRYRAVILLAPVDVVREAVVRIDAVKLRRRLVPLCRPRLAGVERDVRATVVGVDHDLVVVGIDPEVVRVTVGYRDSVEGSATVDRLHHRGVEDVDRLFVDGVGEDLDVVPRPGPDRPILAHERPRGPRVVRAKESATRIGLDHREDPIGIRARHVDRRLTHRVGQARVDLVPGIASIRRLPEAASRSSADHLPGEAPMIPERRVQDPRVGHVHRQIRRARVLVDVENELPAPAAVRGAVDPALLVRAVRGALRRDVHEVGIPRMHPDSGDRPRPLEADVRPGASRVGRSVHAVTV